MSKSPPPYSTTTYVLAVILGGLIIISLYLVLSVTVPAFISANNAFVNITSNLSGANVSSVSNGNTSIEYLNSSYDQSENVVATVSLYLATILTSPLSLAVIAGISLVIYALFEVRRRNG